MILDSENIYTTDPLLDCLVIFTKINGRPYSAESLTAGLPIEDGMSSPILFSPNSSKGLFSRAASKAGFKSKISKVDIDDISPLVLPCILILKSKDETKTNACILLSFDETQENAKIVLPELGEVENNVSVEELKSQYFGLAVFLKKEMKYDDRELQLLESKDEHWFWGTLQKVKSIYRDVIVASLILNIFILATPLFTMNVYDRVVPNNALSTLWVLAIGVIVIYGIDLWLKFIRAYFLELAGKKCDIIMSSIIFQRVMDLKMSSLPKSIGSFANILKEFESIRGFLTSSTISLFIDLPFVIIFLVAISFIGGSLVVIPVLTMVIIMIYTIVMKRKLNTSIKKTYKTASNKNGVLIESLSSIEALKTLGAVGYAQWKWEEATGNIAEQSINTKFLSASITSVTGFLLQLNTVGIIIAGVYMIEAQALTMGGLIATVIISSRAISPMGQVASLLANYEHTKTSYEALETIMNLPVEHPDGKKFVQRPEIKGIVEFKNVDFTYPGSDKSSLSAVSLRINQGDKVAIVGKIGSGKSTIQKLILGLYYANSGSVMIDGIDIKQIDPAELRKNIAYVSQDITLFSGTVRENIIYSAPHAYDDAILKAAKISGVLDFVNQHPKGFDMPVGERGSMLSGGQRQSIAIARAIILNSPIVILDEPTSSMDNASENQLIKNLNESYLKGKTVILVTHKTSLLKLVDKLVVMENGKIILNGDKDDVISKLSV